MSLADDSRWSLAKELREAGVGQTAATALAAALVGVVEVCTAHGVEVDSVSTWLKRAVEVWRAHERLANGSALKKRAR